MTEPTPEEIKSMTAEDLIKQYTPLIIRFTRKYSELAHRLVFADDDDLKQAAAMGIIYAQKLYDPAQGTKFLTYAYQAIKGEIWRLLRIRWTADHGTILPPILASLDAPLCAEDPEAGTVGDMIPDPDADTEADALANEPGEALAALDKLGEDDRKIITGIALDGMTLREYGERIGITTSATGSRYRSALNRLHNLMVRYSNNLYTGHIGIETFNRTNTSETERAALNRIEIMNEITRRMEA